MKKLMLLLSLLIIIGSCKKDAVDYMALDKKTIGDYLSANGLTAQSTSEGVYYIIDLPGGNTHPTAASTVKIHYRGYLTDGTTFDETTGTPITLSLTNVIKGWQIGVPLFGKGGKGHLFIPSDLGYGATANTKIPAHSVLIFDIVLSDFN